MKRVNFIVGKIKEYQITVHDLIRDRVFQYSKPPRHKFFMEGSCFLNEELWVLVSDGSEKNKRMSWHRFHTFAEATEVD